MLRQKQIQRLYINDVATAKATNFQLHEIVFIDSLMSFYVVRSSVANEDPPDYNVIEPLNSGDNIRLLKQTASASSINGLNRIDDFISIGSQDESVGLAIGDGIPSSINLIAWDGSGTPTDISSDLKNSSLNPYTLTNDGLYISSTDENFKIQGLEINIDIPAILGSETINIQYWNGITWSNINILSIINQYPFRTNGNKMLISENSELISIDYRLNSLWQKTELFGVTNARYWLRIIPSGTLTQMPIINQVKLIGNSIIRNRDGSSFYFGSFRTWEDIGWRLGDVESANVSPSNSDVYASDTFGIGRIENAFANGTIDRSGLLEYIPKNCDTSCPLRITFTVVTLDSSGGEISMIYRTTFTNDNEYNDVFTNTTSAPTNHPQEIAISDVLSVPSDVNKQQTYVRHLDISRMNPNKLDLNDWDNLWLTFQRSGNDASDTHSGTIVISNFKVEYAKISSGECVIDESLVTTILFNDDFESGNSENWNVVGSITSLNTWTFGSADFSSGTSSVYVSNDVGISTAYDNSPINTTSICHLYNDFTIPSEATSITLDFFWKCQGEDGAAADDYDYLRIFAIPTTTTPISDIELTSGQIGQIKYVDNPNWLNEQITIPTSFIGTDVRIVFSWKNDSSVNQPPAACIDNLSIIYTS